MKTNIAAPTYEELTATLRASRSHAGERLQKTFDLIEETIANDHELSRWIASRIKQHRVAGRGLEDALKKNCPCVNLMSTDTGTNDFLHFTIIPTRRNTGTTFEWEPPAACLTRGEYWHQGDHNSGFHWNRIVAISTTGAPSFERLSRNEVDSSWLQGMCQMMHDRDSTRDMLHAYRENAIATIVRGGSDD